MVDKGIAYLEKSEGVSGDFAEGGEILVGYTINKVKADPEHPIVKKSIAKARGLARSLGNVNRHDIKLPTTLPLLAYCFAIRIPSSIVLKSK